MGTGACQLLIIAAYLTSLPATNYADASPIAKRAPLVRTGTSSTGDVSFMLGNTTYLANVEHPKATVNVNNNRTAATSDGLVPFTVISVNRTIVSGSLLRGIISSYVAGDDVFSTDFTEGVYVNYDGSGSPTIDSTAMSYLQSLAGSYVLLDTAFRASVSRFGPGLNVTYVSLANGSSLPGGPYAASISSSSIALNTVYRLYRDSYRNFLYGTYDSNDGADTFNSLDLFYTRKGYPLIPVPSRIYSWSDSRPLAGARVAIKDLFDMKGLVTSGGSQAWADISPVATVTAPAIRRIADQGGVLVGKYKLAQFASGANPWNWEDEQPPWNPRGDEYLSCSASSSGGGCSIAAYDWLDFAIGTDTGSSMRRPAAVSGTYGNRPSQGMISMENALPLGEATDTAGVFARDPRKWSRFAKNWYTPDLQQGTSSTRLPSLSVPDTTKFPKRVFYLTDYLPMANREAEAILQRFLTDLTRTFDMRLERVSFASILNTSSLNMNAVEATTGVIATITQYNAVGKPLVETWARLYDGRYPPVDPGHRDWANFNTTRYSKAVYDAAVSTKREAVDWFERSVLYSTADSCSESIMIWDIGTGGLPSFRDQDLNSNNPAAAFLGAVPRRAAFSGAKICPIFGCVDMTLPIGQVSYKSNVTFHIEYMPVTVSVIAKRGCDFMLWNMWERLADIGVLKTVKTGRRAF